MTGREYCGPLMWFHINVVIVGDDVDRFNLEDLHPIVDDRCAPPIPRQVTFCRIGISSD
jgi:hypothetical protein